MGDYGQYVVPTAEEMINFKVGQPAPSMLPLDRIREAASQKFGEEDPMFLQYGHLYGYPKFRQALSEFLSKGYNAPVDPERLLVTNGVTGGLALIASLFLQAGDLIFMEDPSYFLAKSIMKDFNVNVRQIPMEKDGLNIDELQRVLERGVRPKALYTIPTCHNPTGRTMSVEKRKRLVDLSVKYNFFILADEVYQLLSFPHVNPPPPMFTFDEHGTVLALGSFSKILAPSLRLGWIQASPAWLSKITGCGQLDSSGGINPVVQGIAHTAITSGHQQEHLDWTRDTLWSRANTLMTELKKHLPESATFELPDGGYFILVKMPEGTNAGDLLPIAQKHKVMFLPGSSFSESMKNYVRLSFSWYDADDMALGARRLADAIKEYLANLEGSSGKTQATSGSDIKVAVHGANGRLGQLITSQIEQQDGYSFAGAIDLRKDEKPSLDNVDVVVDVTLPQGTQALVTHLMTQSNKPALVVGTTGDLPMDLLAEYGKQACVCLKSNFSVGVPLVSELARKAALALPQEGWNVELSETHHTAKKDAPSGTAKTLAKSVEGTGAACLTEEGKVPTHSLRLGDEIGQHTLYFAGPGERIEITHQATRREVFAIGALRAASSAVSLPAGVHEK